MVGQLADEIGDLPGNQSADKADRYERGRNNEGDRWHPAETPSSQGAHGRTQDERNKYGERDRNYDYARPIEERNDHDDRKRDRIGRRRLLFSLAHPSQPGVVYGR